MIKQLTLSAETSVGSLMRTRAILVVPFLGCRKSALEIKRVNQKIITT